MCVTHIEVTIVSNLFSIQCQQDSTFTTPPTCTPIQCGEAPSTDFATIEYNDEFAPLSYMTTATYTCDDGYYLEGLETLTCMENGIYVCGNTGKN